MKMNRALLHRQKLLLALLQTLGGRVAKTDFQKYLFLFSENYQEHKSYEFVPHQYGCFSFQSYADRRKLKSIGILKEADEWELVDKDKDHLSEIPIATRKQLSLFKSNYFGVQGNKLIRLVYQKYPYYAINSLIAEEHAEPDTLKTINESKPKDNKSKFFTIGYEGSTIDNYINRLIKNNIKLLCDVRKNPISRKYGFSKNNLSKILKKFKIEYIHIPELGITSEKRQGLISQANYEHLFKDYEYTTLKQSVHILDNFYKLLKQHKRIAITCFEADHSMCHRSRIAKALSKRNWWKYKIAHV